VLNINQQTLNDLVKLLSKFLERKPGTLSGSYRSNPQIVHYYYEIIRYWNKINYILKRRLNPTNKHLVSGSYDIAKYLIAIYRIVWEKEETLKIVKELNLSKQQAKLLNNIEFFSWKQALKGKNEIERLSLELAIPSFLINKLLPIVGIKSIKENFEPLKNVEGNETFTFRTNDLWGEKLDQNSIDFILKDLDERRISVKQDIHFSRLFHARLKDKKKIVLSKSYKDGKLVIQDKASFTVVHLLQPHPNELICDMCAAPGIKTSIVAQLSQNQARIIASDFSTSRLNVMRQISRNLNVLNTHVINSDSIKLPVRFTNFFDKVLLDAPCTGSGTFSTNPELKWRQNEGFLHQNVVLQEKLLKSALKLLKPSGVLVYSTCSFYPEEGELQVLKILDNFEPMELPKWFSPGYKVKNRQILGTGRLFPAIHQTKGFFIGKFKKK
jgi:16S rRNA (cytosine967-C5)-methyltransferase